MKEKTKNILLTLAFTATVAIYPIVVFSSSAYKDYVQQRAQAQATITYTKNVQNLVNELNALSADVQK
jgi:hypothetical protein